jgi:hypothetical protein
MNRKERNPKYIEFPGLHNTPQNHYTELHNISTSNTGTIFTTIPTTDLDMKYAV